MKLMMRFYAAHAYDVKYELICNDVIRQNR